MPTETDSQKGIYLLKAKGIRPKYAIEEKLNHNVDRLQLIHDAYTLKNSALTASVMWPKRERISLKAFKSAEEQDPTKVYTLSEDIDYPFKPSRMKRRRLNKKLEKNVANIETGATEDEDRVFLDSPEDNVLPVSSPEIKTTITPYLKAPIFVSTPDSVEEYAKALDGKHRILYDSLHPNRLNLETQRMYSMCQEACPSKQDTGSTEGTDSLEDSESRGKALAKKAKACKHDEKCGESDEVSSDSHVKDSESVREIDDDGDRTRRSDEKVALSEEELYEMGKEVYPSDDESLLSDADVCEKDDEKLSSDDEPFKSDADSTVIAGAACTQDGKKSLKKKEDDLTDNEQSKDDDDKEDEAFHYALQHFVMQQLPPLKSTEATQEYQYNMIVDYITRTCGHFIDDVLYSMVGRTEVVDRSTDWVFEHHHDWKFMLHKLQQNGLPFKVLEKVQKHLMETTGAKETVLVDFQSQLRESVEANAFVTDTEAYFKTVVQRVMDDISDDEVV